jgi:hypothetical protein
VGSRLGGVGPFLSGKDRRVAPAVVEPGERGPFVAGGAALVRLACCFRWVFFFWCRFYLTAIPFMGELLLNVCFGFRVEQLSLIFI